MSPAFRSLISARSRRMRSPAGWRAGTGWPIHRSWCGSCSLAPMAASARRSSFGCGMPAEPAARPAKTPRAEAGSIAILALWGVALIGILLAAATFTTRTEVRIAENAIGGSHARLAAEAGTQLGLLRLLRRRAEGVAVFDGAAEPWQDGSIAVEIAIIDEAGKIDLNQAPLEMLAGLFVAIGRPREEAVLLACNILDRRGETDAMCPQPADDSPPPRHLFVVPEEAAQLPGFGERLYQAVADYLTVATGATAIDPRVATRPV